MADQTSVDYDQASVNSSEMATASDHADPAATTIDNVTVNQTTTTWSDHAEATTCKDAYTRALENLKACIEATKADIDKLKTNYDRAVAAFQQGDLDTAAEAEGLIRNWKMNRTPINAPAPPPAPADGSVPLGNDRMAPRTALLTVLQRAHVPLLAQETCDEVGEALQSRHQGSRLPRSSSGNCSSASCMRATMSRQPPKTKSSSCRSVIPASRG